VGEAVGWTVAAGDAIAASEGPRLAAPAAMPVAGVIGHPANMAMRDRRTSETSRSAYAGSAHARAGPELS
jgi:hypothetical protein